MFISAARARKPTAARVSRFEHPSKRRNGIEASCVAATARTFPHRAAMSGPVRVAIPIAID
jgi:hypothetical protein